MQGPSSSNATLPENINFDHGSASNDSGIESQMPWSSSIQSSVQNRLPEYRLPSNESNAQYLHHVRREGPNVEWNVGETSSSSSHHLGDPNELKMEHAWTIGPRASNLALEERQFEQSNIISLDNIDVISNVSQNAHGLRTSSSNALPQDLNMISGFVDPEDDDCQVVERPSSSISIRPSNQHMQSSGNPSDSFGLPSTRSGYAMDEREDGRRMSCKRKALEVNPGQSSGVGSSSFLQNDGRSQWHTMPSAHAVSNATRPTSTENDVVVNNISEPNPRLRLGVGAAASASAAPFTLTSSGNPESSRRNLRLRINGLYQQDPLTSNPFSTEADVGNVGNVDVSSSRYSSRLLQNQLFDMTPPPAVENASLHVPPVRRHHQSRWSGASSRSSRSSAAVSEDRTPYGESSSRHIPRSISEHPMFVPASEMGNSSQNPTSWNFNNGNNSNAASSSRAGASNPSAPSWSHRSYPQYPRRLSEIVRRSLLSNAGAEAGGQNSNNHGVRLGSSTVPQEMVLPAGSDGHGNRVLSSRSAYLDRHLDGAFGVPYSLRTLAAAGEGRGSIMSEQIRQVLDLMRRGEGLRFEDVMILDRSVLFGMADIHDRHRDMRLDVDNMSYEELLALEERIGNVSTGLSEDAIVSRLKRQKYVLNKTDDPETEPCSICREEYKNGEDLGALECGHNFHTECIKQWLTHKNLCPICKTTGLHT